jgi:protein tyrosine phosphatase (PTP) superfamily phosphohydrolase (DUF442 family)
VEGEFVRNCTGLILVLGLALLVNCRTPEEPPKSSRPPENLHRISEGVYSGASPEGDNEFEALAVLGVKTVVSVDGAKPEIEAAKKHGLRYVHLPIGYDGVSEARSMELAKAIQELPGPVYIHCHHGKHRGPAAAAVACVVAGKLDNEQAIQVMKEMGTGEQYLGLWAAARTSKPADPAVLHSLAVDFREVASVPPLAEAMVAIDGAFDRLELCKKSNWTAPKDHPDLSAAHESLQIREITSELSRMEDCRVRPEEFRRLLESMKQASADLESRLRGLAPGQGPDVVALDQSFGAIRRSCSDCHKAYRNSRKK